MCIRDRSTYGTGAIMAVPAHDDRDWEFAKKFGCEIIEVVSGGEDVQKAAFTAKDETCLLYTSSGSKFYELLATQQDYIAVRSQNWLPSYSVIEMDDDSFTIDTYQITADGQVEAIDQTFTIEKQENAPETPVEAQPMTRADAVQALYEDAGSPAASGSSFTDVSGDAAYALSLIHI